MFTLTENVRFRGALLYVACDIPVCRKVCGFLGHNANLGCSKCLKRFPGGFGSKDYSAFDRTQWLERTPDKTLGILDSVLPKLDKRNNKLNMVLLFNSVLPNFDPISMAIIDPVYILYIGTAKHFLKDVWIERGLITNGDMRLIQDRVDSST